LGNFYTNITVKGPEQERVADVLRTMGRGAVVSPTVKRLTIIYDADSESQDGAIYAVAQDVSKRLGCVALAVTNHDDSVLYFQLFRNGKLIDQYNSSPNYFDNSPPAPPAGGDAALLCRVLGRRDGRDIVGEILRFDPLSHTDNQRYVFEVDRHSDLVKALGLSPFAVGTGYNSFAKDELPEELRQDECLALDGRRQGNADPIPSPVVTIDYELLLTAAAKGDVPTVSALLAQGADPNWTHPYVGHSPLYNACVTDTAPMVKALLEQGAEPNLRLNYRSPVDGRTETGVVALMYARSADVVRTLISGGADVAAADSDGVTSLIKAAHCGNEHVVRALLDAGASPDLRTRSGKTAADVARADRDRIARYASLQDGTNLAAVKKRIDAFDTICALLIPADSASEE
jgi:hypothetical protein